MIPEWKRPTLEAFLGPAPGGAGYITSADVLGFTPGIKPAPGAVASALQMRLRQVAATPEAGSEQGDMVRRWLMEAAEELLAEGGAPGFAAGPADQDRREREWTRTAEPDRFAPLAAPPGRGMPWWAVGLVFVATAGLSAGVLWLAVRGLAPAGSGSTGAGPSGTANAPVAPASAAAAAPPAASSVAAASPGPVATGKPSFEEEPAEPSDAAGLIRLVRRAAERSATDRAAGARALVDANAVLERRWDELAPGERTAALDGFLEAVLRLSAEPEVANQALRPLLDRLAATGPVDGPIEGPAIAPLAWSTGVLLRVERERDLPREVLRPVREGLRGMLGAERAGSASAFPLGAATVLRAVPLRLLTDPAPTPKASPPPRREPAAIVADLKRWEALVRAAVATGDAESSERLAEAVMLDGIERVLVRGPEPDADRRAYESIAWFASTRRWRPGDPGRRRLIQWFDDPRVSTADLHALTSAIIGRSSAEGLDLTMILAPTASESERSGLRAAYERAWNFSRGRAAAPSNWNATAREQLAVPVASLSPAATLRQAAMLAVLNRAAWLRGQGRAAAAEASMATDLEALKALDLTESGQDVTDGAGGPSESSWAARYVQERVPARQAELINQLAGGATLTDADAEILMDAAVLSGVHPEVREAARKALLGASGQRSVAQAALEALPRVPRSAANATLLESIAVTPPEVGWQHERWPARIRAALVERMLELLAARGPLTVLDRLSVEFALTYEAASGQEPPADLAPAGAGELAADAAERLYRRLRARAGQLAPNPQAPLTLEVIDQRLAGRLSVARGKLPEFAAFQASAAEALAFVVSAENPARAPLTVTIVQRLDLERRAAAHVFEQVYAAEAAMLRLHLVAAGESGEGAP